MQECSGYTDIYIKLTADSSGVDAQYSTDGVSYDDFTTDVWGTFPSSASDFLSTMGNTYLLMEFITDADGISGTVDLDYVKSTGMTSTEQY